MSPDRRQEIRQKAHQAVKVWREQHGPPPDKVLRGIASILRSHYTTQARRDAHTTMEGTGDRI